MFKHIITIIWAQRATNVWIWVEMVLVSVFLWYIVDDIYTKANTYVTPLGFEIDHTYRVSLSILPETSPWYITAEESTTSTGEDLLVLIERIRNYSGVEAVSISEASYPYNLSSNNSDLERRLSGDTIRMMRIMRRHITPDFFHVFRYSTANGETTSPSEGLAFNQIVLSEDVAKVLYPEGGSIVGKPIYDHSQDTLTTRVGAVTTPIRPDEFNKARPAFFRLITEKAIAEEIDEGLFQYMEVCLRVKPEADKNFETTFRKEMKDQLRYNNIYLMDIRSFDDIRERYIRGHRNNLKMYVSLISFLLINLFLGIVGTFWFRTQYRRGEMGLRIALGSTVKSLRTILIGEGNILLMLAFIPAMLISLNVGLKELVNVDLMPFTPVRFMLCQLITFVLMAGMIILGIGYPARSIAKLEPAEALRYE